MRSKYTYATKLADEVFSFFLCLSALKNRIVDNTIKTKSKYPLLISSSKTSTNFSIQQAYKPLNTFSSNYVKVEGGLG